MASLKEVKGRINSVSNTRKITSAMKMVASAKLHKAQNIIENMRPYEERLNRMLTNFLSAGVEVNTPFAEERPIERVALVVFSSNTSLAGAFNSNVIKKLTSVIEEYEYVGANNVWVYPIGNKVAEAVRKHSWNVQSEYPQLADKPSYKEIAELASLLMELFLEEKVDRVELIYNHFKSTSSQVVTRETFLPLVLTTGNSKGKQNDFQDYIIEPSPEKLLQSLLPKVLKLQLYTALLDSNAAEHAARTVAMQIATDNADDLLQELKITYNKTRQQAITNELLDIVGGSMH